MNHSDNEQSISTTVEQSARRLADRADALVFGGRTAYVYNPLQYAWAPHAAYIRTFGNSRKRVLFLGMNPGPWGMAQTGVPFGEITAVRTWLGIDNSVTGPVLQHPKKPIRGFNCTRSEVSGRRLWGLMQERFGSAQDFFADHYVANYCPLIFLEEGGKNLTPDKLPAAEREGLFEICDAHLRELVAFLQPEYVIGVGKFAAARAHAALSIPAAPEDTPVSPVTAATESGIRPLVIDSILHPSPASPLANRGWAPQVSQKLVTLGIWDQI